MGNITEIPAEKSSQKSIAARTLSLVGELSDGEATGVLLLAANAFLLLASYYLLKTVREALILTEGGAAELQRRFVGEFYGGFFGWVNLLGVVLQTFAVSRIFKLIGVRGALFLLPCIAFLGSALLMFLPVLSVVKVAKVLENGTDYSVQNTARQAKRAFPVLALGKAA